MTKALGWRLCLVVLLSSFASHVFADELFSALRGHIRASCVGRKAWKAPIRLQGIPLDVGSILWVCPASFRLEYLGPGAFEYSSNGIEAWVARPSFSAPRPDVEHYWRLAGTELDWFLAYVRGDETKLATLVSKFKAASANSKGVWGVTLTPFKPDNFSALRLEWSILSGQLTGAQWTSVDGLPLLFDIGRVTTMNPASLSAAIVPQFPAGTRITKIPAPRGKR
ncbi:MAG: hypothetical protein ABIR96_01900 [Bdellovibrionota bacterium]